MMKPVRILHVLGSMNRGGVETWLMHILRQIDRERFRMDFLVHTNQPASYDEELINLGSRILRCPYTRSPIRYARRFLEVTRNAGPFDVVHSHSQYFSGYVMWLARLAGIPMRITHSHNVVPKGSPRREQYVRLSKWLIRSNCTHALAVSQPAARSVFGPHWQQDSRASIVRCSVDLTPFRAAIDRTVVRGEFGYHADEIVFGHVGRFVRQKNHRFFVEIAAEVSRREPRARFLLVGEGPLQTEIEQLFCQYGIRDRATFTGPRPDVPRLMLGAMDAFLFPSFYEGLGLVVVEAQAAGLATTISDAVPLEADVVPALIKRLSLDQPASTWAESALQDYKHRVPDAIELIERGPLNVVNNAKDLLDVYSGQVA